MIIHFAILIISLLNINELIAAEKNTTPFKQTEAGKAFAVALKTISFISKTVQDKKAKGLPLSPLEELELEKKLEEVAAIKTAVVSPSTSPRAHETLENCLKGSRFDFNRLRRSNSVNSTSSESGEENQFIEPDAEHLAWLEARAAHLDEMEQRQAVQQAQD